MALEVFELLSALFELLGNWRLWLSIAIGGAIAFAVYWFFPDAPARTPVCTVLVASGFLCGLYWQYRADAKNRAP
jgi:hypothetical protein